MGQRTAAVSTGGGEEHERRRRPRRRRGPSEPSPSEGVDVREAQRRPPGVPPSPGPPSELPLRDPASSLPSLPSPPSTTLRGTAPEVTVAERARVRVETGGKGEGEEEGEPNPDEKRAKRTAKKRKQPEQRRDRPTPFERLGRGGIEPPPPSWAPHCGVSHFREPRCSAKPRRNSSRGSPRPKPREGTSPRPKKETPTATTGRKRQSRKPAPPSRASAARERKRKAPSAAPRSSREEPPRIAMWEKERSAGSQRGGGFEPALTGPLRARAHLSPRKSSCSIQQEAEYKALLFHYRGDCASMKAT